MRRLPGILALVGVATVVAAPVGDAATRPVRKVVTVHDNYYSPAKLTIPLNSTVVWKWPADAGDVHDVKLGKGPRGAKRFWSEPGAAGYSFKRKLTVAGTYRIVCSLHEEMKMTITVRR